MLVCLGEKVMSMSLFQSPPPTATTATTATVLITDDNHNDNMTQGQPLQLADGL